SGAAWLYLYDTTTGSLQLVDHAVGQDNVTDQAGFNSGFIGEGGQVVYAKVGTASVANNGLVAYADGSNNLVASGMDPGFITSDVYLYDPATQANRLVSFIQGSPTLGAGGVTFGAVISADGSHVAYVSDDNVTGGITTTVIDNVFSYDVQKVTNTLVSTMAGSTTVGGNANSGAAGLGLAVSSNGQFIAFTSEATNLVPMQSTAPGNNVFLYNSQAPGLTLVSGVSGANATKVGAGGVPDLTPTGIPTGPNPLSGPVGPGDPITGAEFLGGPQVLSMSSDGSLIAYVSNGAGLLPGQSGTLPADNVFLYSRSTGQNALASGVNGSATAAAALESSYPALSGDGSLLAFHSQAANLDGLRDNNGVADVFTYTPASPGAAALASRAAFAEPEAPGDSFATSVSADGRYTVFTSNATNLVPNQVTVNTQQNVYLFDNQTGTVRLVNHVPGLPATTGDGGVHPLFFPSANTADRPPDYVQPVISADGSTVAFASFDDNLVANESVPAAEKDQTSHPGPVIEFLYLYNVADQSVTLVNHVPGQPATVQAPSANGGVFYDSLHPAISADGSFVAFAFGQPDGDEVGVALYNRATGLTTIIKSDADTNEPVARSPGISDDGRFVSYLEQGQVYVYDRVSGRSVLASHDNSSATSTTPANGASSAPVISHDGSAVAFVSAATNLVPGQVASGFTNVFLYRNDLSGSDAVGAIRLVSGVNGSATAGGNGSSDSPAVSNQVPGDGNTIYVAYRSDATNLVAGQSGAAGNIFEFNTQPTAQIPAQTLVSHQAGTAPGAATAGAGGVAAPTFDDGLRESPVNPVIDDDGHLVSYASTAGNLIPGQTPTGGSSGMSNLFVWLRPMNANILASGQDGSPMFTGDFDSDAPLMTRGSFPIFTSLATNLVNGIGGTSVVYINTLVSVALSPNTVAVGSGAGSLVGDLAVTSLLAGQFVPPVYSLPAAELDNHLFGVSGNALLTEFPAAAVAGYQVSVHFNIGFGNDVLVLNVFVAAPAPGGGF
ncbi:MAG TPA: hypothetical protein VJ739_19975, partial [Gemmataceae bacterium]|nr:hypothetical protein [Gemmataceae bacterium]